MNILNGSDFYDENEVFKAYLEHRSWEASPNELIEKPVILELLNYKLSGTILDLGCGYGDLANEVLSRGATNYTGIDSSHKMIDLGKSQSSDQRVEFIRADITRWAYPGSAYDTVIARLVFHYIADLETLLRQIRESMKKNGELVCSVEHPVLTSSMEIYKPEGQKGHWQVDEYFNLGSRVHDWLGGKVIKYHRTLEEYWRLFTQAGFSIESIKEGCPKPELFKTKNEFERRKRIPLFLLLKAIKL